MRKKWVLIKKDNNDEKKEEKWSKETEEKTQRKKISVLFNKLLQYFPLFYYKLGMVMGVGGGGGGQSMESLSLTRMILFYFIFVPPYMMGKTFLPHPRPLGPHKTPPHPIKLYFLLICPTINTIFLIKPISLIKICLKLQLNLSHQIKSIFRKN